MKFNVLWSRVSDQKKKNFCTKSWVGNLKFDVKDLHRSCNLGVLNLNFNTSRFLGAFTVNFWRRLILVNALSSTLDNILKVLYLAGNNNKKFAKFCFDKIILSSLVKNRRAYIFFFLPYRLSSFHSKTSETLV